MVLYGWRLPSAAHDCFDYRSSFLGACWHRWCCAFYGIFMTTRIHGATPFRRDDAEFESQHCIGWKHNAHVLLRSALAYLAARPHVPLFQIWSWQIFLVNLSQWCKWHLSAIHKQHISFACKFLWLLQPTYFTEELFQPQGRSGYGTNILVTISDRTIFDWLCLNKMELIKLDHTLAPSICLN